MCWQPMFISLLIVNLLWDANRKTIELRCQLSERLGLRGWRKYKQWLKKLKTQMRRCSKISQSGGANKHKRLETQVRAYLKESGQLYQKVHESILGFGAVVNCAYGLSKLVQLEYFHQMQQKHIDLIERRILESEKIPSDEKLYSLFEPHTHWIQKGKQRPYVELGHKLLITTDHYGLILDYQVLEILVEHQNVEALINRLQDSYGKGVMKSFSTDKGFSTQELKVYLQECLPDTEIIMPKKGKKTQAQQQQESTRSFRKLRNAHSAIESDINSLEHHGLNRCPDKGLEGFKRYVGLGVLSYNLHKIGNKLLQQATAELKQAA